MFSDHYYAHWLLTEAIDDYGQLFAFTNMHKTDTKNGRITEDDLIPPEEFQIKMEENLKQLWKDPVNRARILAARKKTNNLPEIKLKRTEGLKKRYANPEYKVKFTKTMTKVNQRESKRLDNSKKLKAKWQEPEYIKNTLEARLKSYAIVDSVFKVVEEFNSRIELDKVSINVHKFLDKWEIIYMKNPNKQKYNGLLLLRYETYQHYMETGEKIFKKKRIFKERTK